VDPITIGLAFTAAQSAVGYIKQAIALGKDINSLAGQFSKFFESSDSIHRERTKLKAKANLLGKTDAELGHQALQLAMHSDALRQAERELKDMILWQLGKPQIWEQMIAERTRLFRERAEEERQLAHKKKMADQFIFAMYFIAGSVILFAIAMGGIGVYGAMEEKRIYEEKVAKRNLLIRQQQKERDAREKKEREDYAKN